jgi:hypothetical protein
MMKRLCVAVLLVCGTTLFALEKGNMVVNLELGLGYVGQDVGSDDSTGGRFTYGYGGTTGAMFDYYLSDRFSACLGAGVTGLFSMDDADSDVENSFSVFAWHITVPVGIHFQPVRRIMLGAGELGGFPRGGWLGVIGPAPPYNTGENLSFDKRFYLGGFFEVGLVTPKDNGFRLFLRTTVTPGRAEETADAPIYTEHLITVFLFASYGFKVH